MRQKIVLLGTGNVATHLFKSIQNTDCFEVIQVYNRHKKGLDFFKNHTDTTTDISQLLPADLYLVSISDDATAKFIAQLPVNSLVAHTSGSVPLQTSQQHNGVFYPLQTFSKEVAVDFSKIPLCVEADSTQSEALLLHLAQVISSKVYRLNTDQRKKLHLAAVFACNFVNHMYALADTICEKHQIPFDILQPLIAETAHKIESHQPAEVQTGPAIRHDQATISAHLQQLHVDNLKEIYTLLTQSIQAQNGSKL